MHDIETRLFRYFVALAEEEHFSRAALRLKISPPTLTHQIKKLEGQLGAKLAERKGNRHIQLTEAGRRFLEHARGVLQQVREAEAVAQRAARGEIGHIRIGYQYVVSCAGILQAPLMEFQRANPAIEVTVHHLVTMEQINAILRNDLDIGFARPPRRYPDGLQGFVIYRQPAVLALPAGHRLAQQEKIKPSELAGETFVNPPVETDLVFNRQTETVSALGKFVPKISKRAMDSFTVLTYVSAGYGIAAVSKSLTTVALPNVVYREIDAPNVPQTTVAVLHRLGEPAPAIKSFIEFMRCRALRD